MNKILLGTLMCLLHSSAYAADEFYATVGAGWTIPSINSSAKDNSSFVIYGPTTAPSGVSIFNLPNTNWENKYKNGFNLNAALGYRVFNSWYSDIEFLYQKFKRKVTGNYSFIEYDAVSTATIDTKTNIPITQNNGYTNVYSLLTNGYYKFKSNSKWTPMLGGGLGVALIRASSVYAAGSFIAPLNVTATPTLQRSPELSGTAFAWQIKASVAYDWSKSTSVIMQYRLFGTSSFTCKNGSITTNPNAGANTRRTFVYNQDNVRGLLNNSIELALRFKL